MRQLKIASSITNRESTSIEKYLCDINREERIDCEEEVRLARLIREGDQRALDRLTRANLRFVVSVAKQYQGQGLALDDLINEGNMGLITAAQKFDESRGFKFISYAVWWIRQSILQALAEDGRLVRLPLSRVVTLSQINTFLNEFLQTHERRPTLDEIAEGIGQPVSRVADTLTSANRHLSVDAPITDDEGAMVDLMVSNSGTSDKQLIGESLACEIERVLAKLPERESTILHMYFGIGCHETELNEIAIKLGLSRERTRQLKDRALRQLRSQKDKILKSYLG